jgi:hypothetical protein
VVDILEKLTVKLIPGCMPGLAPVSRSFSRFGKEMQAFSQVLKAARYG